jgi:hypothetical protein
MCGLFGVATSEGRKEEFPRKRAFTQGLQLQEWRGEDATGVAIVPTYGLKSVPKVIKHAMAASDFIRLKPYEKNVWNKFDEHAYVLGHARSATYGRGDSDKDFNAHPFQVGDVTLTHNGHIRNAHSLGSGIECVVDSAHVAGALSNMIVAKDVLEKLEGPFALVWHDARDGSLNFARNGDRPLWWCYVEKENTMFWGSELEGIYAVLRRNDIKIDGKFKHCTPMNHFKFQLKNLREVERVPFVARQLPIPTSNGLGPAWNQGVRRLPGRGVDSPTRKNHGTGDRSGSPVAVISASHTERMESPLIRTVVTEMFRSLEEDGDIASAAGRPSRPTSRKKIRRVTSDLFKLGRKLDSPTCFTPTTFSLYANQTPARGEIAGRDKVGGCLYAIPNSPLTLWEATKGKKIYGRISNVKKNNNGDNVIVCDFAPELQERFVDRYKAAQEQTRQARESLLKSAPALSTPMDVEEVDMVEGPMARKITVQDFTSRTKGGCSNCSKDIEVKDAPTVMWCGNAGQYPICGDCANDPKVQEMFGSIQGGF